VGPAATGSGPHLSVQTPHQHSLYYTDANALDVKVEVSAVDSARQTATVTKDAGGAEDADCARGRGKGHVPARPFGARHAT